LGHDELTLAGAGSNLGWPGVWRCEEREGFVRPILVWEEALPPGGLALYQGFAFIGALGSKNLERVRIEGGAAVEVDTYFQGDPPSGFGRLREVVAGPDGRLYVTTSNCDGRGVCGEGRDRILRLGP
jgi:glucose/arabinose dehydrogenase